MENPIMIMCTLPAVGQTIHLKKLNAARPKPLNTIQLFKPKASGNLPQALLLKSACPDSHLSTQLRQISGKMRTVLPPESR